MQNSLTFITHYCAVWTKYCEGLRGYDTEPILIVNVPVGLVEKRVIPEGSRVTMGGEQGLGVRRSRDGNEGRAGVNDSIGMKLKRD